MRTLFVVACALALAAAQNIEDEPQLYEFEDAPEGILIEAKSTIKNLLSKGAKESDCKDLAKTMCKDVEDEIKKSQQVLDKLSTGKHCETLGQTSVAKAKRRYTTIYTKWETAKKTVTTTLNTKVEFGWKTFSELKEGECGWAWSNSKYQTVKKEVTEAKKTVIKLEGEVKEAKKAWDEAVKAAKREVTKCLCTTKETRNTTWTTETNTITRTRQVKAHAKCKMMTCVLEGVALTSTQCKSSLTKLTNKKLTTAAESANC